MNSVHILLSFLCMNHFNNVTLFTTISSKLSLSFWFLHEAHYTFLFSPLGATWSIRFILLNDHPNNILWRVQINKRLTV
jgi:hypothetical protein